MKFDGVLLYCSQLQRSIDFYEQVLGVSHTRVDDQFAIIHVGNFSIYLHEQPASLPAHLAAMNNSVYRGVGAIFHFQHESVDACAQNIRACGYEISYGPVDQVFGRRQMYLYDPDGYNIVIEQPLNQTKP